MSDRARRRELRAQYENTRPDAGVYLVRNNRNGRALLGSTSNLASLRNKMEFARGTDTPGALDLRLRGDIREFGIDAFSIEVLDVLDTKPDDDRGRDPRRPRRAREALAREAGPSDAVLTERLPMESAEGYTLNVALNFSGGQRTLPGSHQRQGLAAELLDELTGWNAHDRMGAFRSWHRGALSLVHLNVLTVLEADGPARDEPPGRGARRVGRERHRDRGPDGAARRSWSDVTAPTTAEPSSST